MEVKKKNGELAVRLQISLPKPIARKMDLVYEQFGLAKSAQIATLVSKYLQQEFPFVEPRGSEHQTTLFSQEAVSR